MGTILQDIRYSLRQLRKTPGFSITAILTFALGISANTLMFSVLNTVLLRPLPYPRSQELVQIWGTDPRRGEMRGGVSPYDFLQMARTVQALSDIAVYRYNPVVLKSVKTPERINAEFVSADFFKVFEISPIQGRTFLRSDDDTNERLVVLSFKAWSRYFDRDPNILGKPVTFDDDTYTVIGVMPVDFMFPNPAVEAWCLHAFDPAQVNRKNHFLFSVGRLRNGTNLNQAQEQLNTLANNLNRLDGRTDGIRLVGLQEELVGSVRRRLLLLWAAVTAVLLIACANIVGLLLARAVSRQREVAIRVALGAGRWRLLRQFITESLLLAVLGGLCSLVISAIASGLLVSKAAGSVPRLSSLQTDYRVLTFAGLACLISGLACGILPAMSAMRLDPRACLNQIRPLSEGSRSLQIRSILVAAEFALATMLLVAGGLLIKTLWRLEHLNPGFQAENILTFRFSVPKDKYDPPQLINLYDRILDRLRSVPGVEAVGAINDLPFAGSRTSSSFEVEGRPPASGEILQSDLRMVSSDYMHAMRIRLVAGRGFSKDDGPAAPLVAIVNETFAKRYLSGGNPLDRRLKIRGQIYQVIGIAADVKFDSLAAPDDPAAYILYAQIDRPSNWIFVTIRAKMDTQALLGVVRSSIREIAPDQPIYRPSTMTDLVASWIAPQKFSTVLLIAFASLALLLAGLGVYGLTSYIVVQRMRELGIRIALGASRIMVLKLILAQGVRVAMAGAVLGIAIAWIGTRVLSSVLFDVEPHDPVVFLCVVPCLMFVLLLGCFVPTLRAIRVDPLAVLRYE